MHVQPGLPPRQSFLQRNARKLLHLVLSASQKQQCIAALKEKVSCAGPMRGSLGPKRHLHQNFSKLIWTLQRSPFTLVEEHHTSQKILLPCRILLFSSLCLWYLVSSVLSLVLCSLSSRRLGLLSTSLASHWANLAAGLGCSVCPTPKSSSKLPLVNEGVGSLFHF